MAHVISWDSAFNSKPVSGDKVGRGYANIQETRQGIQERLVSEHEFDLSVGTDVRQGLHKAGSAVAFYQASAPTQRNGVDLAAADAGIEWIDSDNGMLSVWSGTEWVAPFAATGTANTLVLRDANGDILGRALESTVATGTAPLRVASTTKVANLDADTVDGQHVTSLGNGLKAAHGVYSKSSVPSGNELFDALAASIPTTGDWIMLSGSQGINNTSAYSYTYLYHRAVRSSNTVITLYGILQTYETSGSTPTQLFTGTCTDGDAGAFNLGPIYLCW